MEEQERENQGAEPLDIRGVEKLLASISYFAASAGLAAAGLSLVLWYGIAVLLQVKGVHLAGTGLPVVRAAFIAGLFFLPVCAFLGRRLRQWGPEFEAGPEAAEYFQKYAVTGRKRIAAAALFWIGGFVFSGLVPYCIPYRYLDDSFYIGGILAAGGAFFTMFLFWKRRAYKKITLCRVEAAGREESFDRRAEAGRALAKWLVYWVVVFGAYFTVSLLYKNFRMYAPLPVLAAINFILRFVVNNPFRRYASLGARRVTTRFLNVCAICVVVWLYFFIIQSGSDYNDAYIGSLDYEGFAHSSSFTCDQETGVYTVTGQNEEFRILQLTDIHICASITTIGTDRKAFDACYALIREAQPDLIIVTGDIVFPIPLHTFSNDNLVPIYQFCKFMNNIGIPWAMVYGNHDTEMVAKYSAEELTGIFRFFRDQPDCPMLYTDRQPDIYGRYNQYLRIENADRSLNRLVFLIDSNDYVERTSRINEYDSVHEDQIRWYAETIDSVSEEEGRVVPSFVFMHIPFRAFADAQEALKNGSPDAVYLFGENGEGVCHPDRDTGFFDAILEKGSTQAVFVGHDHLNNMAVRYRGVDLVYSKSIDYIAYPGIAQKTEQRGATLIVLSQDGTYRLEQLDY
ncbi:MAG: metallophosphoesterase [Lachnospiraceae bacterium]|nr:metallophosphoesterase [Lachnospiraceae bacterium]